MDQQQLEAGFGSKMVWGQILKLFFRVKFVHHLIIKYQTLLQKFETQFKNKKLPNLKQLPT